MTSPLRRVTRAVERRVKSEKRNEPVTTSPETSEELEGKWMTRIKGRTRPVEKGVQERNREELFPGPVPPKLPRSQHQARTHVRVRLRCQGKSMEVRTLMDSGNTTWSEGPCLSLRFVENHDLVYTPVVIQAIGTAAEGSTLEVVGVM